MFKGTDSIQFHEQFNSDDACYAYLAKLKWANGFTCKKCGCTDFTKGNRKYSRRCKSCFYDESVTANTMFHRCKMGIRKAFVSVFEVASNKKGIASTSLSSKISVNIKTAQLIRRKIQKSLSQVQSKDTLKQNVEVDEFSVGGRKIEMQGRSLDGKKHAIVALEFDNKNRSTKSFALPIKGFDIKNIRTIFDLHIDKNAQVITDGFRTYLALQSEYPNMDQKLSLNGQNFLELHHHIFNLKNWIRGIHHHCSEKYFGQYLNEFNFRFNNRGGKFRKNIFNTILNCCIFKITFDAIL